MNKRKLGKDGFEVSEVGLGCWQIGSNWGEEIDQHQAFDILSEAVENGVTFFDTADVYGDGRSERLLGAFFKETTASDIKIATKFGRQSHIFPDNYTEQGLRDSVEASRKRLGVDRIDLLQLHCIPTEELRQGAVFDWLRTIKEEGKIAHFGASVESVEEGLVCLEQEGLQSLQIIYNIFRQKLTKELLPEAHARDVGLIVRLPLASGLLTGKFTRETHFSVNDHRNFNKDGQVFNVGETFAGLPYEVGVQLAQETREFCPPGMTLAEMALRWILDHKEVTTIIPGASSPEQVVKNAKASDLPSLGIDKLKYLEVFYKEKVHDHVRGVY